MSYDVDTDDADTVASELKVSEKNLHLLLVTAVQIISSLARHPICAMKKSTVEKPRTIFYI